MGPRLHRIWIRSAPQRLWPGTIDRAPRYPNSLKHEASDLLPSE